MNFRRSYSLLITGLTAQAVGRDDTQEVTNTLLRGFTVAIVLGIIILLLREPFAHGLV